MIGIEIDCQRLSSPVAALGQLDPKLDRRDIVGSATCERLHVERAPVVVIGSANPSFTPRSCRTRSLDLWTR